MYAKCKYSHRKPLILFLLLFFSVRFDITSDELLKKDAITLENIESDLKDLYGIERKNLLQKLCRALKIFLGFPVGEYLLQNDRKNPNQVKVYEKCEKK